MACAITAQKLNIPVAHVEAGIRSGDWTMPEEINRMVTDAITNWFFTTSQTANKNLHNAGIDDERIFFVGNTMIDTLLANLPKLQKPGFWDELALQQGQYFVATLHRPANVDQDGSFSKMLDAIPTGWPMRLKQFLMRQPCLPVNRMAINTGSCCWATGQEKRD